MDENRERGGHGIDAAQAGVMRDIDNLEGRAGRGEGCESKR